MIRARCVLAALLVSALAACTHDAAGSGTATPHATAVTVSAADTETTLAAAGIATVSDESSTRPAVAVTGAPVMTVTAWQAQSMAAEATAHGGVLGGDLDALFPMPKGSPPIAYLIGGWTSLGKDADERAAAALFGLPGPDWHHADDVVIPTEVIALFVADFVHAARTGAPSAVHTSSALTFDVTDHPCSLVSGFIAQALSTIFEALKLDPAEVAKYVDGALGGGTVGDIAGAVASLAASVWNSAVSFFESAAEAAIEQLTAPVIHVLQVVLGGLATFTMIVSYLKNQSADVRAQDPINRFSHGSEAARSGTFTASVDTGPDKDWPKALIDCAQSVHVTLPKLSRPGAPVTWSVAGTSPGLVTWAPNTVQPLADDLTSRITYTTGRESEDTYERGTSTSGTVWAKVAVRRGEVEELKNMVSEFAIAQVPSKLQSFIAPMIRSWAEMIAAQFDTVTSIAGSAPLVVRYEVPNPEQCTGPSGTYSGPISAHVVTTMHVAVGGSGGAIDGDGTSTMSGRLSLTFAGGKATGTLSMSGTSIGHVAGMSQTYRGTMTGTISGPASGPTVKGVLAGAEGRAPYQTSLHVTHADCKSVSGDLIAVFQDVYRSYGVSNEVTISGKGDWTIPHS